MPRALVPRAATLWRSGQCAGAGSGGILWPPAPHCRRRVLPREIARAECDAFCSGCRKSMSARYCGSCATPLVARPASHGTAMRQSCPACQTTVYETTSIVVATLPVVDDRVVLIRRGIEPGRGRWAYAGGYLEAGETLEA